LRDLETSTDSVVGVLYVVDQMMANPSSARGVELNVAFSFGTRLRQHLDKKNHQIRFFIQTQFWKEENQDYITVSIAKLAKLFLITKFVNIFAL
jgi:hypothetical protein